MWRWSAPVSGGGANTPVCSRNAPTSSSARSSGGRARRRAQRALEFGTTPYVDLDEMLDDRTSRPRLALPAQRGPFRHDVARDPRRAIRCSSRNRSCSISMRPTSCCAEAEERGLFFAINFNHRYARPVQMAHDAITSGALGDITFATWRFGGEVGTSITPVRQPHRDAVPRFRHARAPVRPDRSRSART